MSTQPKRRYTPEEYLALERQGQFRSEYVNGEIYAMSGASREHNVIAVNVTRELSNQLRQGPCEVYTADMRVMVDETGMYAYPDVVVSCGEPEFEDRQVDTLLNPTVIVEVLSPSTEAYDRGAKFAHYRRLPSLREYVLVAQDRPAVTRYVFDGQQWIFSEVTDLEGTVNLTSIGCTLALRDVYERVEFREGAGGPPQGAPR